MRSFIIILVLFLSLAVQSQQQPGSPRVSANKRFFQSKDGKPFFWLGDTGWLLFVKLDREETIRYLDTRKAQGFNVIQVMVLHDLNNAVNRYGDSALFSRNTAKPQTTPGNKHAVAEEYDFWDHVDFVIDAAAGRGLYMALVPVWGTNVKNGWVTQDQAVAYGQFLGKRYSSKPNIIWLNGGDINGSDSIQVWKKLGETLDATDKNHLITFHPRGRTTSSRWFHNEPWLDFNMFQSGHRNYAQDTSRGETHYGEDNWKYIEEDVARQPLKPTLDGEPSYEGIPQGLHDTTQPYWNDNDLRRYAYWSVLSGAAGFTYGHNAVMQFYRAGDKGSAYGAKKYWEDALNDKGAAQMKHLKTLITSRPYFERVADQSLVLNNGERYARIFAARGKKYALFYTYTGRSINVQLGKLAGKTVRATWYNPRIGAYTRIGSFPNTGTREFDPPGNEGDGNDWVLMLDAYN